MMHHAGIKHHPADVLSRLPTSCTDNTTLHDNVSVLVLACKIFAQKGKPPEQDDVGSVINKKAVEAIVPFYTKVVGLADHVQQSDTDIANLELFTQHHARSNECRQDAITVCEQQ